jgi:hypothetical protein
MDKVASACWSVAIVVFSAFLLTIINYKNMELRNRLYERGYRRTKLKELLKPKKSKRKYIMITGKRECYTITGVPINKNGKPIFNQ